MIEPLSRSLVEVLGRDITDINSLDEEGAINPLDGRSQQQCNAIGRQERHPMI